MKKSFINHIRFECIIIGYDILLIRCSVYQLFNDNHDFDNISKKDASASFLLIKWAKTLLTGGRLAGFGMAV